MDATKLFLQMLFALMVVSLGAVVILRYLVPRLSWTRKMQKSGPFELISRFGLDAGLALYLIKVGRRYLLLGGGNQGVRFLTEVNRDEIEQGKD